MIRFVYNLSKGPHFVPLCSECEEPILDAHDANLEIDESCLGGQTKDCRVYHLRCAPEQDWFPWTRFSEVCYDLTQVPLKRRKYT